MSRGRFINIYFLLLIFVLSSSVVVYAEVRFSGYLSGVSTYVWRGIKANNGPALQSDASLAFKSLTLGFWGSSVNFGDDVEVETDLYADVTLPTGDLASSLGMVVYMFDFRTFNQRSDAEYELYAKAAYGVLGLGFFYIPEQNSTKGDERRSLYWLELSANTSWLGADLSALLANGTYSSRWMPEGPTKDPVSLLLLTAAKPVTEEISVYWTGSLDLFNSGFENIFYFGGIYSF